MLYSFFIKKKVGKWLVFTVVEIIDFSVRLWSHIWMFWLLMLFWLGLSQMWLL